MLDLLNLLLYCVQQLGVMLGVGAETVILVAYLLAIRDGLVDSEEERFARAVKKVLYIGIICILASGLPITFLEFYSGQGAVVFAPAYLFKALLIAVVLGLAIVTRGNTLPEGLAEGVAGGTWYALFVVHILAPVATWGQLWPLYAIWLVGFVLCWSVLVFALRGRGTVASFAPASTKQFHMPKLPHMFGHTEATKQRIHAVPAQVHGSPSAAAFAAQAAKIAQPPIQPASRLAPIQPAWPQPARPQGAPVAAAKTAPAVSTQAQPGASQPQPPGLQAVRVMPRTLADLQKQNRVLFN